MRRRDFIKVNAGSTAGWPLAARAQQKAVPVIGLLSVRTAEFDAPLLAEFARGMSETGFVEGTNAKIEYRWAGGEFNRLPSLAEELVRRQVALIVTLGGTAAAQAAKAASTTIPIAFAIGDDPVQSGLVTSLHQPGGNVTGATNFYTEFITLLGSAALASRPLPAFAQSSVEATADRGSDRWVRPTEIGADFSKECVSLATSIATITGSRSATPTAM